MIAITKSLERFDRGLVEFAERSAVEFGYTSFVGRQCWCLFCTFSSCSDGVYKTVDGIDISGFCCCYFLFCCFFFISIGSLRRTVSAFHGAVYAGGRQAIFVVAGAIFEIAFEAVVLFEEFHTLGELRSAFKVGDGHFEDGVLFVLQTRTFFDFAYETNTFEVVCAESGSSGTTRTDVRAINVPTFFHFACEDNVNFSGANALVRHAEAHLCCYGEHAGDEGEQEKGEFMSHLVVLVG